MIIKKKTYVDVPTMQTNNSTPGILFQRNKYLYSFVDKHQQMFIMVLFI